MKNRIVVMLMVAVFALPAMAQISEQVSQASFQSTSTMTPSGSAYSSTPLLNADGTVSSPANGPRRGKAEDGIPTVPTTPGEGNPENQFPVGEPWVLLAMAAAAAATIAVRRRRAAGSSAGE